jgi:putative oxidoreductase
MSTILKKPVDFEPLDVSAVGTGDRIRLRTVHRSARERTVYLIARLLLGVMFGVFGLNGFVPFLPAPSSIPPEAMTFFGAMVSSHFSYFVFGAQMIAGFLLLFNRYVPLAIVTLAAILANIWAYHITMWPAGIFPMPIVATILWFVVAWSIRPSFAPLLTKKAEAV